MRRVVLLLAVVACQKTPQQKLPAVPVDTTTAVEKINAEARAMDSLPQAARFTPAYAARFDSLRKVERELVRPAARR
jgi:hypothetical protein